ncbi:diguanylate cyclase [Caballeronia temeraria]|uniref:Diguanylate cyclase n=1 Tax=Caballeronia temeraria TaxID=1777137 RepID=A0A158ATQ6_9BURK|nr:GGDEF domain-containing protein [Caballeronia temeraria]SAK61040.1 diguanylate cyclase [Caballeronia temeraria]
MMRPGLMVKLSLLLALIGVLASGSTGYYAYRANRSMLVGEAGRNLLTATELLGQRFSVAIDDMAADVLVLATMPSSALMAQSADDDAKTSADRSRLAQVFSSFMLHHPVYLQARLIARDRFGLERIRFDRDGHGIVEVQGENLQEKGQFAYMFDTLKLEPGRVYIGPITINREYGTHYAEGKPILHLAAPVATRAGDVVGVVVLDVDLAVLLKLLRTDLPPDYELYIANEWGDFLVHPDASQAFGFDKGRRVFMQDSFAATKPLFDRTQSNMLINGLTNPEQAPNEVLAFVRRPFGTSAGNRFIVLGLGKPLSDVLAGANRLGDQIVRMVLFSSVAALLLAILFARALTRPLQVLTHAATHFFAETATEALPLKRTDEIGMLARCFDRMRREIRSQVDALHHKQHQLAHLANHDVLTSLPNRMLFMQKLDAAVHDATANGKRLAVLFIDLDHFKQINDQFGHSFGDAVLVAVADALQRVLSRGHTVARLGGDEFVVLIEDAHFPESATDLATSIVRALESDLPVGGRLVAVGASVGISECPQDGVCARDLLLNADTAMYVAKSKGRGFWQRYCDLSAEQRVKIAYENTIVEED